MKLTITTSNGHYTIVDEDGIKYQIYGFTIDKKTGFWDSLKIKPLERGDKNG